METAVAPEPKQEDACSQASSEPAAAVGEKPKANKQQVHTPISWIELVAGTSFFVTLLAFGFKNLFDTATYASRKLEQNEWAEPDQKGHFIASHYQDIGDMEWVAHESNWRVAVACGLINAAATWLLAHFQLHHLRRWSSAVFGLAFLVSVCGLQNASIFVAEDLLVYASMRISQMPLLFGWLVGAAHIFVPMTHFVQEDPIFQGNEYCTVFSMWAWMWSVMRYASFGSEWQKTMSKKAKRVLKTSDQDETTETSPTEPTCNSLDEKKPEQYSFELIDFLGYMFYTPCIFASIITYRHYSDQVIVQFQQKDPKRNFSAIPFVRKLATVCFWLFLVHLWAESFMFYTVEYFPDAMTNLDGFGAAIMTWAHGQYFQAKYMILYGIPLLVAFLDYGVELTPLPIFISRVYLYSNMWKHFDTGLYDFLKSYIYIPVGAKFGKQAGGALTFFFIWAWHGTNWTIALWTVCNFIQIVVEGLIRASCNNPKSWIYTRVRSNVSGHWWRRMEALAGGISFTFSIFAISFFLMGHKAAMQVVPRTFYPNTLNLWIYIAGSYAWVQTVFSYENWMAGGKL